MAAQWLSLSYLLVIFLPFFVGYALFLFSSVVVCRCPVSLRPFGREEDLKKKLFDVKFRYHLWFFVKVLRLAISWKKIAALRASTSVKKD